MNFRALSLGAVGGRCGGLVVKSGHTLVRLSDARVARARGGLFRSLAVG